MDKYESVMLDTINNITAQNAAREIEISELRTLPDKQKEDSKNKEKQPNQKQNVYGDGDTTALSVISIIRFLENILEERLNVQEKTAYTSWYQKNAVNTQNAKCAASAYAHAAEIAHFKLSSLSKKERTHTHIKPPNNEEIYSLILSLRDAHSREIRTLNLQQNLPFYQSIKQALTHHTLY